MALAAVTFWFISVDRHLELFDFTPFQCKNFYKMTFYFSCVIRLLIETMGLKYCCTVVEGGG